MSLNPGLQDRYLFYNATAEQAAYLFRKFVYGGPGIGGVSTVGSSTTVTGATGGTLVKPPLDSLSVGDIVVFRYQGTVLIRKVATTPAGSLTITVDTAVNLANGCSSWEFYKKYEGQTDADGWIDVSPDTNRTVFFYIPTLTNVLDFVIQGKLSGGLANVPIQLFQRTVTVAADIPGPIPIGEDVEQIRVGLKSAAIGGNDSIYVHVGLRPVR